MCHETIYQALYIQAWGGPKRELVKHLRTGSSTRQPQSNSKERRGRISDMVMISARLAEADDRAIPGRWEGDLIMGSTKSRSATGTLVEHTSGFLMLLHLLDTYSALTVQDALVEKITQMPKQLQKSLTRDQGKELTTHLKVTEASGMDIYSCDPHSPLQRGSN